MAYSVNYLDLFSLAGKLGFDFDHFCSCPGERIENHNWHAVTLGIDVSQNLVKRDVRDLTCRAGDVFQIALGIEIVHCDSGTGHDIMEVIEEQIFPGKFELILPVRTAEQ